MMGAYVAGRCWILACLWCGVLALCPSFSSAQSAVEDLDAVNVAPSVVEYPSLFMSSAQRQTMLDVRNMRGPIYAAYMEELERLKKQEALRDGLGLAPRTASPETEMRVKPPEAERYISLEGLLFTADDQWIAWLNGQKITPKTLPAEVLRFRAHPTYAEIAWFDAYSNKIIPVRLRPMERFHIDHLTFLPGR